MYLQSAGADHHKPLHLSFYLLKVMTKAPRHRKECQLVAMNKFIHLLDNIVPKSTLSYRGSSRVMLMSLHDSDMFWLDEVSDTNLFLSRKKPGCLGCGSTTSLPNVITTYDMLGLSSGSC